jgi:hypothetical protein
MEMDTDTDTDKALDMNMTIEMNKTIDIQMLGCRISDNSEKCASIISDSALFSPMS